MNTVRVCGREYIILRLLGHGKGGYSYLARAACNGTDEAEELVVLKQIHHEPCAYYTFGNKIEAERYDYERLRAAGIRIPKMLAIDTEGERIVKEFIDGPTVFELVRDSDGEIDEELISQVREMAARAKECGLNIDYFPTNFVLQSGLLYYVDYECNQYSDEWSFESWGIQYWSKSEKFLEHLKANAR